MDFLLSGVIIVCGVNCLRDAQDVSSAVYRDILYIFTVDDSWDSQPLGRTKSGKA